LFLQIKLTKNIIGSKRVITGHDCGDMVVVMGNDCDHRVVDMGHDYGDRVVDMGHDRDILNGLEKKIGGEDADVEINYGVMVVLSSIV
jgi:hypothetical protein